MRLPLEFAEELCLFAGGSLAIDHGCFQITNDGKGREPNSPVSVCLKLAESAEFGPSAGLIPSSPPNIQGPVSDEIVRCD